MENDFPKTVVTLS